MEPREIIPLIQRYLAAVESSSGRLREQFGVQNLVEGRRSGRIPREGKLEGGGEFSFHGVGCRIDDRAASVDFDFGPGGRTDGFDAWRLHVFARDNPATEDTKLDTSEQGLEAALLALLSAGGVYQLEGDSLFYLPQDG